MVDKPSAKFWGVGVEMEMRWICFGVEAWGRISQTIHDLALLECAMFICAA